IQKHYGKIPASDVPKLVTPVEPKISKEFRQVLTAKEHGQQVPGDSILIGYRTPNANHPDMPAIEVANSVLTTGKSSRLYRKLVEDQRLATVVGGSVDTLIDPGLYQFSASMNPGKKAESGEKVIDQEIDRLKKSAVDEQELTKAKNLIEAF